MPLTFIMDKEENIYQLGCRVASGELTEVQYNYWLSQLGVSHEEALAVFRKREEEITAATAWYCFKTVAYIWIAVIIIVKLLTGEWHFPGFN